MSHDDSGPRLGQKSFTVLMAVLMASAAYLVMAARFGDPLRKAREAAADAKNLQATLPNAVEHAVSKRMSEIASANTRSDEAVANAHAAQEETKARLAVFEGQLAAMRAELDAAHAASAQASREMQALRLAAPAPTGVHASPATEYRPSTSAPTSLSGVTVAPPAGVQVARSGPFRMEIVRARATPQGIVLDCTMTRERDGDARIRISGPTRITKSLTRVILASGTEIRDGRVVMSDGRSTGTDLSIDLLEGVPARFTLAFSGKFQQSVLCKRIQVRAYYQDSGRKVEGDFMFSDILASP